jgi:hypothetical protein
MVEASGSTPKMERVVLLVHWVKGMREIGCVTFLGEEDVEIARHWLRNVERVMTQMPMPKESRVDCAVQMLVESAHS